MKKQTTLISLVCLLLVGGAFYSPQITQANPSPILGAQQQAFLNALRRERVPVSIYLVNGIKLQGQVEGFNDEVIFLKNSVSQMIFIHAVSTVVPARNVSVAEDN